MPIDFGDGDQTYKLISIDPGTYYMGVCVYEVRFRDRAVMAVDAFDWIIDKMDDITEIDTSNIPTPLWRLRMVKEHFKRLMPLHQPSALVCEQPFFNPGKPNAFGALVKVLAVVQNEALDYNHEIDIRQISPFEVKKTIGASLSSDKETVKAAILLKPELVKFVSEEQLNKLGKDAIDAIAIGYTHIEESRKYLQSL